MFESVRVCEDQDTAEKARYYSQPTIHDRRYLHLGEAYLKVQKYSPPAVGAAELNSASAQARVMAKTLHTAHCAENIYELPSP